jgi:hypothetical protein
MKRLFACFIFATVLSFSASCFAQSAKIIKIQGKVSVRTDAVTTWHKAKLEMFLDQNSEIKTEGKSECTLALDDEMKNVMTVKENSQIKLESIIPSRVYLPEGRVFSIINNISKIEKFEIRTPTAIAGARGTGLGVGSLNRQTDVSCFKDVAYVEGYDANGNKTGQQDVPAGYGLDVGLDGEIGNLFELGADRFQEWNNFEGNVEELRGTVEGANEEETGTDTGSSGASDLNQDRQENTQDTNIEQERQNIPEEPPPEVPGCFIG